MKILKTTILLLFLIGAGVAHSGELLPVDEGARDPIFNAFRHKLLNAISRKDQQYLLRVLAPNIINNFGGDGGKDEFVQQWKLGSEKTKIWKELQWVLTHGGSFDADGVFCAPYVSSKWPEEYDSFEYAAVIADGTPLRKTSSITSAVVTWLRYSIVYPMDERWWEKKPKDLVKVKVGAKTGFVQRQDLRSSTDYRACFEKQKGKWVMNAFVAGD